MEGNKFVLLFIAVFFDSYYQGKNFHITSIQYFYSKQVVVLQALLLTKMYNMFPRRPPFQNPLTGQWVKAGIMLTSEEIDFRFHLKLKITFRIYISYM